ncbi:precorrin-3B synthase [Phyllobacterium phragmitis]|uniref:Precorrin-3B synthase n=1 Tax=Phyllobacterium phragmitis TaxID=2670329 RepID=A0A2S9IKN0_9HYPH|nr:precorrin-3B synthase [Phyllobacterium phragmitis]PRD41079.1 precorrin-3B synthase [Phyllobacterium phragmitis]
MKKSTVRNIAPIKADSVERRSACPGLFRMTPARDGRICRVKLSCGRLVARQARAVADVADRYGNGIIEITNRANLQLRGIGENDADHVILALTQAGLGPLVPEGDDIRNVMVNPAAGIDDALAFDIIPLAESLLETLQTTPAYHALSPKFSILLDGGEACAVARHTSDIWLAATQNGKHFAFGLASCPPVEADDAPALGMVAAENTAALVTGLLDLFLELSTERPGVVRMKHLLTEMPASDILERLRSRLPFPIEQAFAWRRPAPHPFAHLGVHQQRQQGLAYAGAATPLGRLMPQDLRALADLAVQVNDGHIRLTPWQSVLLPDLTANRADDILERMNAIGLASDPAEPLASMIACSGSNGCAAALADTQTDGVKLAQLLKNAEAVPVHLTGCAKSCASIRPAPATLVAVEPGRYDLFLRATAGPSRFGRLLAANITIEEAARLLNGRVSSS